MLVLSLRLLLSRKVGGNGKDDSVGVAAGLLHFIDIEGGDGNVTALVVCLAKLVLILIGAGGGGGGGGGDGGIDVFKLVNVLGVIGLFGSDEVNMELLVSNGEPCSTFGDLRKWFVKSAGDMASLHMGVTTRLLLYSESDM